MIFLEYSVSGDRFTMVVTVAAAAEKKNQVDHTRYQLLCGRHASCFFFPLSANVSQASVELIYSK